MGRGVEAQHLPKLPQMASEIGKTTLRSVCNYALGSRTVLPGARCGRPSGAFLLGSRWGGALEALVPAARLPTGRGWAGGRPINRPGFTGRWRQNVWEPLAGPCHAHDGDSSERQQTFSSGSFAASKNILKRKTI